VQPGIPVGACPDTTKQGLQYVRPVYSRVSHAMYFPTIVPHVLSIERSQVMYVIATLDCLKMVLTVSPARLVV